MLLDQPARQVTLSRTASCPAWIDANADADGYYRVLYEKEVLSSLLKDDARVLSAREKVALIGDVAALTGNGEIQLGTAMSLVPDLAHDSNRRVVVKTMDISLDPRGNLVPVDVKGPYHRYLEDLYGRRSHELGWTAKAGESEDDHLLREHLLGAIANQAEDAELVAQAKSLATAWLDNRRSVAADMEETVLSTAARHGDQALFDRMRAAAKNEKDERAERNLFQAMGVFPPEIANAGYSMLLSDEFKPQQSIAILFGAVDLPANRQMAYDFVKHNWDALIARLPEDWGSVLPFVAGSFCDEEHRRDAAEFFEGRSTKYRGGPRNLAQVLEGIDLCIAYQKAQQPSLHEFLARYGK